MSNDLIAAVVHADGVHPLSVLRRAIAPLRRQGTALAGVIELESTDEAASQAREQRLKNLATGEVVTIADCDVSVLNEMALGIAQTMQADPPHLLVVSNFGRVEAAGGGMRRAIRAAIDLGIPRPWWRCRPPILKVGGPLPVRLPSRCRRKCRQSRSGCEPRACWRLLHCLPARGSPVALRSET